MESGKVSPMQSLINLIRQQLKRDPGWKEYYEEQMDAMPTSTMTASYLELYELEREAALAYKIDHYEQAESHIQSILDRGLLNDDELKGWYKEKSCKICQSV